MNRESNKTLKSIVDLIYPKLSNFLNSSDKELFGIERILLICFGFSISGNKWVNSIKTKIVQPLNFSLNRVDIPMESGL